MMNLWKDYLTEFEGLHPGSQICPPWWARLHRFAARCLCDCRAHRRSPCARRSPRDLYSDVEFQHPLQAETMDRCVTQTGLTFRFDPAQGYTPLNRGRIDMATPYSREALRFIGASDVRFVPIGPTAGPSDAARTARQKCTPPPYRDRRAFLTISGSARAGVPDRRQRSLRASQTSNRRATGS